ncbi:uncharacterized protein LOC129250315 [Anastrepha obliqua]|uniref:uncharacterized protein LOC129250315 n=1 Tax=Anastrepha obliqua TaxID=95512 RepID=UPI002409D17D|nr:uncharacterized protein LOC129250315 [Anastrepha obliqua]
MAHNAFVHTPVPVKSNVGHEQTALYHERHSGSPKEKQSSLFRYVDITIRNAPKSVDTYALTDEGASCILIESEVADDLDLDEPSKALYLRWTNEITQSENNYNCDPTGRDRMDDQVKAYFTIDTIGVYAPAKPLCSKDDERALQLMKKSTKFLPTEKRWETKLLWKQDVVALPDSLPMARHRLMCLDAKMKRDLQLHRFMVDEIDDYKKGLHTQIGVMRYIDMRQIMVHPVFMVLIVNKNKTRLVRDAAAKAEDMALNNMLLKGPDQLSSMMGILLRFREKPFAICGDLHAMFHQVKVAKENQVAQKFL